MELSYLAREVENATRIMNVVVRAARDEVADQMAAILNEIVSIGRLRSR